MSKLPVILFLVVALGMGYMLWQKQFAPTEETGEDESKPFPNISVITLDGKYRWNPQVLKGQVTLVNFFASWCTPCAAEMPELVALKKQFPGLKIQGIAWNDTPEKLNAWLAEHGNPFDHTWLDRDGKATINLGIRGIPESIIVDSTGTIRYRLSGPLTAELREGDVGATLGAFLRADAPVVATPHKPIEEPKMPAAPALPKLTPTEQNTIRREEQRVKTQTEKERKAEMRRLRSPMLVGGSGSKPRRNH